MSIAAEFLTVKRKSTFRIPNTMVIPKFGPIIEDIRESRHREYVFKGGRGSTKSSFVSLAALEVFMNNKQLHWLVLRDVKDTLKDSVYAQICWAISSTGLEEEFEFKTSPLEITRKSTGQKIYFRGADKPTKIKSIKPKFGYIGILWFEELDQFKGEEAVRSIEQSALRGGSLVWNFKSFNPPKSSLSWANRYSKEAKSGKLVTHNTFEDVPREWLGDVFLEEAEHLRQTKPEAYEHEYLGVANGVGGAVFDNVTAREITDNEIKIFDRIYNGQDWGWYPDPNRFVKMHYQASRKELYIFGELSGNKISNEKWQEMFEESGFVSKDELIIADSAEKKSVKYFRDAGYLMKAAKKGAGSVETGMKWLLSLCSIIVDPVRCPHTYKEFSEYEYLRDKNGEVISGYPDENNHSIDAVRYATEPLWRRNG
ncbi:MAG: PBSX family phage terminase large subunit [Clostridia bacterium]|nr:PBSX family phage terminase large subunit [Clostridia bacterium]